MLIYFIASLKYFTDIRDILWYFVFIWYIFSGFGILCQEKSGDPDLAGENQSFLFEIW
jgi:hypothetical protein